MSYGYDETDLGVARKIARERAGRPMEGESEKDYEQRVADNMPSSDRAYRPNTDKRRQRESRGEFRSS